MVISKFFKWHTPTNQVLVWQQTFHLWRTCSFMMHLVAGEWGTVSYHTFLRASSFLWDQCPSPLPLCVTFLNPMIYTIWVSNWFTSPLIMCLFTSWYVDSIIAHLYIGKWIAEWLEQYIVHWLTPTPTQ